MNTNPNEAFNNVRLKIDDFNEFSTEVMNKYFYNFSIDTKSLPNDYLNYHQILLYNFLDELELNSPKLDINDLPTYNYHTLEQLQSWTTKGEVFHSEELTVKTTFGDYSISADLFSANSYNEYLQKLLEILTHKMGQLKVHGHNRLLPSMQIYQPELYNFHCLLRFLMNLLHLLLFRLNVSELHRELSDCA